MLDKTDIPTEFRVNTINCSKNKLLIILNDLGTQPLYPLRWDLSDGDERVELFLGVFILVPLASDADPDPPRNTADPPAPYLLVQLHIDSNIRGSHGFLGKLPDLLYGLGSFLLKGAVTQKRQKNL